MACEKADCYYTYL